MATTENKGFSLEPLTVGVFAVEHAQDAERIAIHVKTDTEIADAQPELGGIDALQLLHFGVKTRENVVKTGQFQVG